jgi:hypothetical protein
MDDDLVTDILCALPIDPPLSCAMPGVAAAEYTMGGRGAAPNSGTTSESWGRSPGWLSPRGAAQQSTPAGET